MGNTLRPLCHREHLGGACGILAVCDGRVVEVEEVDSGLGGRGLGMWRLGPSALCPVREGDWGSETFCLVVGAWVGARGGGPGSTQGGAPRCTWCLCGPCSRR